MAAGKIQLVEDLGMLHNNPTSKYKYRYGMYECVCGNIFKASTVDVNRGHTKSCGCLLKSVTTNRNTSHGESKHRLYGTWSQMMSRCYNETNEAYSYYGGRGITVCDEWHIVANFIADMESTYKEDLTIDRIDGDKGYCPDNCRWESRSTQAQNTRAISKKNTSGFRGVYFHKKREKYAATICSSGKRVHIGYFDTALDAGKAYNKYVVDNNLMHTINNIKEDIYE